MSSGPFKVGRLWDAALTDKCTISTINSSVGTYTMGYGIGGFPSGEATTTTNVPCRLQHDSTGETQGHEREESTDSYTLYITDRHNILTGDVVTMLYKGSTTSFVALGDATASGIGSGLRKCFLRRSVK